MIGAHIQPASAAVGINKTLNFQGKVVNSDGTNVPDSTYSFVFSIYTVDTGGSAVWTETQNLATVNGIFQARLGAVTSLPGSVDFNTDNIYLGMNFNSNGEMNPRVQFSSVAQAFNSEKVGGIDSTSLARNDAANTFTTGDQTISRTSVTAFQIQKASAADTLLTANTTNNRLVVGNATGTDTDTTLLVLDTATADPTTNLVEGAQYYNSSTDKFRCYQASAWTDCISSAGSITMQATYDNTADATPEIVLTTAQGALSIQDATSALGTNLLEVTSNGGGATYFSVSATGPTVGADKAITVIGGSTANRPAGTTEGQIFYDQTLDQMLIYSNGKWQADRTTATKIVAASDSQNKEKADYVATGTNDQDTINNAINALPAAGGLVYLLEGTYNVDDGADNDDRAIEINKSNVTLTGSGSNTIIRIADIDANLDVITDDQGGTLGRITISNLRIDGNKTQNTAGTQNGIIFSGVGAGAGSSATPGVKIEKVWVEQVRSNGIEFSSSSNGNIINSTVLATGTTTGDRAIYLGSSVQYNTVTGNTIQGNAGSGIHLNLGGGSNTISSNVFQGNGGYGIFLGSSGNTVAGNTVAGNTDSGIRISIASNNNISGNTVSGNSLANNSAHGIDLSTADSNVISNNRIISSGGTSGTSTGSGIDIGSNSDSNNIVSNNITDTFGTGYAISLSSSSSSNYLADNIYSGTGAASINDASTTTIYAGQLSSNSDFVLQGATRTLTQQDLESTAMINNGYGGIGQFGNLLTYSEQLNQNAPWVPSSGSLTVNADDATLVDAAPDKQQTAEELLTAGTNLTLRQDSSQAAGSVYTFSVWIKSNSTTVNRNVTLRIDGSTGGTGTTPKTIVATPTWTRHFVTQDTSLGGITGNVRVVILLPTSSDDIHAWGAQLVAGSSPGAYAEAGSALVASSLGLISNASLLVQDMITVNTLGGTTGAVAICRNSSNQISTCGTNSAGVTLQHAYDASAGVAPSILTTSTNKAVTVQTATSGGIAAGNELFGVRASNAGNTIGNSLFTVNSTGVGINIGGTGNPATTGDLTFGQGADRTIDIIQKTSGVGNTLTITAGQGASGSTGGNLVIQAGAHGTASSAPGSIIAKSNGGNSSTAFQVQGSTGNGILTVDTTNSQTILGKAGGSGIDGKLVFNNAAGSNTVTIQAPGSNPSSSFALLLPSTIGAANECIKNSATPGTLTFGSCGAGGGGTLKDAYDTDVDGSNAIIALTAADGGILIRDTSGGLGSNLFAVQNNGGTSSYLSVTASAVTFQDAANNDSLIFDSTSSHLKIYENISSPSRYVDIYYDNATSTAIFAASSGTTQVGSGAGSGGNINLLLTNAADQLLVSKTNTLGAAYSLNDFQFTRNLTAGAYAATGNVMTVEDLTTFGVGSSAPNVLYVNQNNTSATGNLILAQTGGSADKFKITTAGNATLAGGVTIGSGASYTGAGAVTLQSAASTALTLTGNAASTLSTSAGALTITSAAASTWSTTTGNLTIQAGGANTVVVKPGTDSTAAVQLQKAGGGSMLNVDTSTTSGERAGILTVGAVDGDATLLVLDTKNDANDPTGTNGAMYYNSNMNAFRCYQNGTWENCLNEVKVIQAFTTVLPNVIGTTTDTLTATNIGTTAKALGSSTYIKMDGYATIRLLFRAANAGGQSGTVTVRIRNITDSTDLATTTFTDTTLQDREFAATGLSLTGNKRIGIQINSTAAGDDPVFSDAVLQFEK